MSDSSCARQRARSSTFIISGHYFLSNLMENTASKSLLGYSYCLLSRVSPTHYPRWHPCKSQPAKSKSQPANTKVSRIIVLTKVLCQQAWTWECFFAWTWECFFGVFLWRIIFSRRLFSLRPHLFACSVCIRTQSMYARWRYSHRMHTTNQCMENELFPQDHKVNRLFNTTCKRRSP